MSEAPLLEEPPPAAVAVELEEKPPAAASVSPAVANHASHFYRVFRFMLFPSLVVIGLWMLYLDKDWVLSHTPVVPGFGAFTSSASISEALPICPENRLQAYELGQLTSRYDASDDPELRKSILEQAAGVVGRDSVTPQELGELHGLLEKLEEQQSIVDRVTGFFSFVNVMWLLAIAGIACSVGPAIMLLIEHYGHLFQYCFDVVKKGFMFCWDHLFFPVGLFCHRWGIFEALFYFFQFIFTVQGARMQPESGIFVSITGVVGLLGCLAYSWVLDTTSHDRNAEELSNPLRAWIASHELSRSESGYRDIRPPCFVPLIKILPGALAFAICSPLALFYDSTLIAYFAVMGLCQMLGFSVMVLPFCYVVGFTDEATMLQAGGASSMLLVGWAGCHIVEIPIKFLQPFNSPVSVLGSIMLFFSLLILSNLYYDNNNWTYYYCSSDADKWKRKMNYFRRNAVFLLVAAASIFVGYAYGMHGMANTGITFTVLWAMEKGIEIHSYNEWNVWLLILAGSVALYFIAMWLHAHPEFIISLFDNAAL